MWCAVLVSVLAACGGGGGGGGAVVPEGYWHGASTTIISPGTFPWDVSMLVLENGETWTVYDGIFPPPTSQPGLLGGLYGTTTSAGGNALSGSGLDIGLHSQVMSTAPTTYSGTFTGNSAIAVTTSGGVTFNASYQSGYDQPASLAALAGTFNGLGASGYNPASPVALTIEASGAFTVPYAIECGGSGTLTPRASGKNVFDVSMTLGTLCNMGGLRSFSGVAYYDTVTTRLVMLALNSAKSDSVMYVAHK
jgi:hypothetical protein